MNTTHEPNRDPNQDPEIPDGDDDEVQSTPAGLTQELEDDIEEIDADVAPDAD